MDVVYVYPTTSHAKRFAGLRLVVHVLLGRGLFPGGCQHL